MTKVDEEEHSSPLVIHILSIFGYIQIDGNFYYPEVLNRKLEEDKNSK